MNQTTSTPDPSDAPTPPVATPEEAEALLEQARTLAQERVADLHNEEGTVKSEGGAQNSPSPEDIDPAP